MRFHCNTDMDANTAELRDTSGDANMAANATKLCNTCRILEDIDALATDSSKCLFSFKDSWPTLDKLALSARSGCGFCQLLKDTLCARLLSQDRQRPDGEEERRVQIDVSSHIASAVWAGLGDTRPVVCGRPVGTINAPTGATHEDGISEAHNILAGLKVRVIEEETKAEKHRLDFLMGFNDDQNPLPRSPLGEKGQGKGFFAIKRIQGQYL